MKICVLGSGAWGTALSRLLALNSHDVVLWGHDPVHVKSLAAARVNERHLPGIPIPERCQLEASLEKAVEKAEIVVIAVPSKAVRNISLGLSSFDGPLVSVTKGIEYESGLTMCGVLRETCPSARVAALSGPTLAMEVARDIPSATVLASADAETGLQLQKVFHRASFRVYTSPDLLGVEFGGALKNVVAIAAGVCDGLGYGDNSKAALLTRAIVEIRRLGVACGASPETFSGLSGLGDLTVTCFSKLSRNRALGERLGRGESLKTILPGLSHVAEGYPTSKSAYHLSKRLQVETPIIDQVYAMLHEDKAVRQAVLDLTARESRSEI